MLAKRPHHLVRQRQPLAHPRRRRIPGDVAAGQHDPSAIRLDRTRDDANERRLAGAIWSDQPNKFAGRDRNSHAVDRVHAAEMDGEILELERRNHGFVAGAVSRRASPARPPGAKRMTRTNRPPNTNRR